MEFDTIGNTRTTQLQNRVSLIVHRAQGRRNGCEGGEYNFASEASEIFLLLTPPPTFGLTGGIKQDSLLQFSLLQLWRLI